MAVNKSKRSIHLAQPQPQHAEQARTGDQQPELPQPTDQPTEAQPIRAHIYRTIADMNGGFEHVIEGLQTLQKVKYLPAGSLNQVLNLICRTRAQANRELMTVLNGRELANVDHFHRLCLEPNGNTREQAQL
jgi:hypothetical protein